jgi:hypothetical protein
VGMAFVVYIHDRAVYYLEMATTNIIGLNEHSGTIFFYHYIVLYLKSILHRKMSGFPYMWNTAYMPDMPDSSLLLVVH